MSDRRIRQVPVVVTSRFRIPRPEPAPSVRSTVGSTTPIIRNTNPQEALAKSILTPYRIFTKVEAEYSLAETSAVVVSSFDAVATGRFKQRFFIGENVDRVEISNQAIVIFAEIAHAVRTMDTEARGACGGRSSSSARWLSI